MIAGSAIAAVDNWPRDWKRHSPDLVTDAAALVRNADYRARQFAGKWGAAQLVAAAAKFRREPLQCVGAMPENYIAKETIGFVDERGFVLHLSPVYEPLWRGLTPYRVEDPEMHIDCRMVEFRDEAGEMQVIVMPYLLDRRIAPTTTGGRYPRWVQL